MNQLQEAPHEVKEPSLHLYQRIADVPVTLRAELDRRVVKIGELMKFDVDTVLPLTRPAGENIDLYIGEVLLGTGEILVVEGVMALRVADLRDKSTATGRDPVVRDQANGG